MKFLYTFAVSTLITETDLLLGCNDIKCNNMYSWSDIAVEEKEYYSRRKMLRIYIKIRGRV